MCVFYPYVLITRRRLVVSLAAAIRWIQRKTMPIFSTLNGEKSL